MDENFINKLAIAGAQFSKHCRVPFTNECDGTTIRLSNFSGNQNDLVALHVYTMLIDYSTCGDLNGVMYLGKQDQHLWNEKKWKKEIKKAMRKG